MSVPIARDMIKAEVLKLRRNRSLMALAFVLTVGVVLLFFGYVRPSVLKYPSDAWWAFAAVLGWINARVLLSIVFFLILTPVGVVWRLTGRDPLARRRDAWRG